MSLTLTRDLIETTRSRVQGTQRAVRNQLEDPAGANASSLHFSHSSDGIVPGFVVEVDLEQYHVWGANPGGNTVEVSAGVNGTTSTTHAAGAMAYVNPEVTAQSILDEINVDLSSLSSPLNGLFAVQTIVVTYDPTQQGYDLDGVVRFLDVLEVSYETNDVSQRWPRIDPSYWRVERDPDPTDFPSGKALILNGGAHYLAPGFPIRITCKTGFAPLATITDNVVSVSGLPASAADIPTLGAAARLLASREAQRNLSGSRSDGQRADEVPPGANVGSSRQLLALRQSRIAEEAAALARSYPLRSSR